MVTNDECINAPDIQKVEIIFCHLVMMFESMYSKTCVKQPLKNRQNKDLNDKW